MHRRLQKVDYFIQLFRQRNSHLFLILLFLTALFVGMSRIQHWFIHKQLDRTTKRELSLWAKQVVDEVAYKDRWDLAGYRQALIEVPIWAIVAKDGLIIDIDGFVPGLLGKVELPNEAVFIAPQTVTSSVGETWRLFGKKVAGGIIIVGMTAPKNITDADAKLLENLKKIGNTIAQAAAFNTRMLDIDVDYAVVASDGEIKNAWGGIPLKIKQYVLPTTYDQISTLVSNNKVYSLYSQPIRDEARSQDVGEAIIPKDMALAQEALRSQDKFNNWVVGIAGLLTCGAFLWFVALLFFSQTKKITLEEALKVGESERIEFKSSLFWSRKGQTYDDKLNLAVLKSIAGFLNAKGGTLFIGVTEDTQPPTVCGLKEDLKLYKESKDGLQRALRVLITERIGAQYSPFITDSLEYSNGQLYWVVAVKASSEPAFVRWKDQKKFFYVREGPKTSDLDNESTWHYIKNRWG
jgi:hypothetical protein